MKFTVLSHAGLLVEHSGKRLVLDPWLFGSAYWRSWWNFPEPETSLIEDLRPDYIYLTHLHWDHFHGPSLRHFDRDTQMLVPKAITRRMVEDLQWLGFTNIIEIPHGHTVPLGNDFSLCSYQFGPSLDSAALVQGGGIALLNANDCKLFGLPLRSLLSKSRNIDFVFRSHSSARAVPYCIEDYETNFPTLRSRDDYEEEFARFALFCDARYAIPFASNHCFLHPDTRAFNSTAVTPQAAAHRCDALADQLGRGTRAVVMPPGSSWDDTSGFNLTDFDYADRDGYIEGLLTKYSDRIERQVAMEATAVGDFDAFKRYFEALMRATPMFFRKRVGIVTFRVRGTNRYWSVDFSKSKVSEDAALPADARVVLTVPANILNDCCTKKMFSVWPASKRLSIRLAQQGDLRQLGLLFTLLDLYELDYFPLARNLSPRALSVGLRRWREGVELVNLATRIFMLRKPFNYREIYPIADVAPRAVAH